MILEIRDCAATILRIREKHRRAVIAPKTLQFAGVIVQYSRLFLPCNKANE